MQKCLFTSATKKITTRKHILYLQIVIFLSILGGQGKRNCFT
ncbi:hypothetical protein HMPREF0539_0436 [Lacticaseibacillus rhamnosus LMS2-1]|uniref:Uncharacterized protein n=1 Tax=Lacticaseibacillus rhamnosus (strain LMS2-1) TaxID=525361 RepID=C2JU52_LACRM|nr:hypothetical protein HMPREF0539_0436 [Lacticaseibacillus rhamnosus LMS2-1]